MLKRNLVVEALILVVLPSCASPLRAQYAGMDVSLAVQSDSVAAVGDTVTVHYQFTVALTSLESLAWLFISSSPDALEVGAPPMPDSSWATATDYRGHLGGWWLAIDPVNAGDTVTGPTIRAVGLPGLMDGRARGDAPVVPMNDSVPGRDYDPWEETVAFVVLGVEQFPADTSLAALGSRLGSLVSDACGAVGWIPGTTLCSALADHAQDITAAIGSADYTQASADLAALLSTLNNSRGTADLSANGYWLLRSNASVLIERLP